MEIITEGYPEENQILVDETTIKYYQNNDCTESSDEGQEIIISTRDNGAGKFINIKTENWSIDDEKEMISLINDFKKRAGINE